MIRTNALASLSLILAAGCAHGADLRLLPAQDHDNVLTLLATYQKGEGGFDPEKKYLERASIELALMEAARGNEIARGMVQKTLIKNLALIDPVDGGAHDYSDVLPGRPAWGSPSPSKSLRTQAINIRLYSRAYQVFGGRRYLEAARSVYRFLAVSLQAPGGGFHEDGAARVPTAENGLAISALVAFHHATQDRDALALAVAAANRMVAERALETGGFRNEDRAELSLDATVSMVEALTALHGLDRDPRWLSKAEGSLLVIADRCTLSGEQSRAAKVDRRAVRSGSFEHTIALGN